MTATPIKSDIQFPSAETYSVTLSRAHKLAERVRQLMNKAQQEVATLLEGVALPIDGSSAFLAELDEKESQSEVQLEKARMYSAAYAHIRHMVGMANSASGVVLALAQREHLLRQISTLKSALDTARSASMTRSYFTSLDLDKVRSSAPNAHYGVRVRVAREDLINKLEADLAQAERDEMRLTDQLADLNAARVQLQLPLEVAQDLSLVS